VINGLLKVKIHGGWSVYRKMVWYDYIKRTIDIMVYMPYDITEKII